MLNLLKYQEQIDVSYRGYLLHHASISLKQLVVKVIGETTIINVGSYELTETVIL